MAGTPNTNFLIIADPLFNRTRLISSNTNGEGQGMIEMRTRQLNVGTNPGVATGNYVMRLVQNTIFTGGEKGMLIQHGEIPTHNWEFFVNMNGPMALYYNGELRGVFNKDNGNYVSTSDSRLKTNIQAMPSIMESINYLQPKKYEYKDHRGRYYHGFLAQELKQHFPELVSLTQGREGEEDVYLVDYSQLAVVAIKAIQEQQQEIDNQSERIQNLEDQLKEQAELIRQLSEVVLIKE